MTEDPAPEQVPEHTVPELRTERLLLRPWTYDDVDVLFDIYSRWEVQQFIGLRPKVMTTREEAIARADRFVNASDGLHGIWAISDAESGTVHGTLLLKALPASAPTDPLPPSGETEIGWHLHPNAWGRGIASEAAQVVLDYAFDAGLPRVLAVTNPANTASQRVTARIGMRPMGQTDAYYNTTCELFGIDRPA